MPGSQLPAPGSSGAAPGGSGSGRNPDFLPQSSQKPLSPKQLVGRKEPVQLGNPGWTMSCFLGSHSEFVCFRASCQILS